MVKQFIRVLCDVACAWEGLAPTYRVYVNNELFAERTWLWTDAHLEEALQIEAVAGEYRIRYELVAPCLATLTVANYRVEVGPARVDSSGHIRILDEIV